MIIDDAICELKEKFSIFNETYDGDDDVYLMYGAFGMFTLDVINLYMSGCNSPQNYFYSDLKTLYKTSELRLSEVENIFSYVDKIFIEYKVEMNDVLNTCIFEAWMGNDYSYNLARKYLSKETCNHYLDITKRVI
ncbi:Uncharacterised protein [Serratia rubidaea]|nr:Uncharacterised protein [Serratia rubidaea]